MRSLVLKISLFLLWFSAQAVAQQIQSFENWLKEQETQYPEVKVVFGLEKREFHFNEPIRVKVILQNMKSSPALLKIHLKKNLFHHFDLHIEEANQIEVEPSIRYLSWKSSASSDAPTPSEQTMEDGQFIELGYLDTFSTHIDLTQWFDFEKKGFYFLKGEFRLNPDEKDFELSYQINEISFSISGSGEPANPVVASQVSEKPGQTQSSKDIAPYEVVSRFLESEKFRNWEHYFEHIHLDSYIRNSYFGSEFYERYISSRADETKMVISDFKNFLIGHVDHEVIDFDILQTFIEGNGAEVAARIKTRSSTQNFIKKFDPVTGQIDYDWHNENNKDFVEEKILYFKLHLFYDTWKIIEKRVGILKRKDFKLPPKTIGNLHENKYKVFGNILFIRQKDLIRPISQPILKELLDFLKKNPNQKVQLKGHTDGSSGTLEEQLELSDARLRKVKTFLADNGIDPKRVFVESYGGTKPIASNARESTMQFNRRVEIRLMP